MTIHEVPRNRHLLGERWEGNLPCGNRGVKEPNRTFVLSGRAEGLEAQVGPRDRGSDGGEGGGVSANPIVHLNPFTGEQDKRGGTD